MARRSVCIFCSSSKYLDEVYKAAAAKLGKLCAQKNIHIINGAGKVGLMGILSDACLEEKGKVTGVIPQFMIDIGWCHEGLSELIVTLDMAQRKNKMRMLSDAIIVLPGGCGTAEEFFETITLRQLGIYNKPIILLNVNGFYDPIIKWWEKARKEKFIYGEHYDLFAVAQNAEESLDLLQSLPERNFVKKN